MTEVLNSTSVTLDLNATLSLGLLNTSADIIVDTTLGQLAGTDTDPDPTVEVKTSSSGILNQILERLGISIDRLTAELVTPLVEKLTGALSSVLGGVIDTIGKDLSSSLSNITSPLITGLSGVLKNVNQVADVTINEQSPEPDRSSGTSTQSALDNSYVDGENAADGFTVKGLMQG